MHPPPAAEALPRRPGWWLIAAVLLAGAGLVGLGMALPALDPAVLMSRVSQSPWAIALLVVGLMVLHNFVPVPGEAIAACAGAALGIPAGIAAVWVGAMLGAAIAFAMARYLGRRMAVARSAPRLMERVDRAWRDWGAPGLLGLRLIPIVSFNLINYGAGLTSVGWGTFLWTTAVGILPMLVLSVAAGAGLHSQVMGPAFYAIVGVVCAGLVLLRYLQRRRQGAGNG